MIPSVEPRQVYAGDLAQWTIGPNEQISAGIGTEFDFLFSAGGIDLMFVGTGLMQDYPPSLWTLNYVIKNQDQSFSFAATADGDGNYVVAVDTTTWAQGKYLMIGYVTLNGGTERHVVRTSALQVFLNPAGTGPMDFRTIARQIYEQILADEANGVKTAEYTIGNRHLRYTDAKERDWLRRVWAHKVAVEEGKLSSFGGASFSL